MEHVTVSSNGKIAIPKSIRIASNLGEGTRLTLEVRGQEIVLSEKSSWKSLAGAGSDKDLMTSFAAPKKSRTRTRRLAFLIRGRLPDG
jgi:AbrB family looped-hinge helix DNA binding protein